MLEYRVCDANEGNKCGGSRDRTAHTKAGKKVLQIVVIAQWNWDERKINLHALELEYGASRRSKRSIVGPHLV